MDLIIEVTRECNLRCEHCLRGEAENKTIQEKDIDTLFKQFENQEFNNITLTGGEPALRPNKIQMILDIAKQYNIDIYNFYIATNGTIASDEFLKVIMNLYLYCSDNEISCVDISNDVFHDMDLIQQNLKKFQMFSFVQFKFKPKQFSYDSEPLKFPDYEYDYGNYNADSIINQGRGTSYGDKIPFISSMENYLEDIEWYLNCNGNIINGCDWSYENQEKHKVCSVHEIGKYINNLEKG